MKTSEKVIEKLILICAAVSIAAVALITIFIFSSGFPVMKDYGIINFITGTDWSPTSGIYGILPLIVGTLGVTIGALIIGIPTGLGCAVFLAEMVSRRPARLFKAAIELLAGIPSVVYGFFGLAVIVPAIRDYILPSGTEIQSGRHIQRIQRSGRSNHPGDYDTSDHCKYFGKLHRRGSAGIQRSVSGTGSG